MNKQRIASLMITVVLFMALGIPVYAMDNLTAKMEDRYPTSPYNTKGRDQPMDYSNNLQDIQQYIEQNISKDIFASLHLEENTQGQDTIILSFVREIPVNQRNKILSLSEDPNLIILRVVDFSEDQLAQKQQEINQAWNTLAENGLQVYTTSVNVFTNRVEIGIEPYNDNSIRKIHQLFGSDMIQVIQGHPVTLLSAADADINLAQRINDNFTAAPVSQASLVERVIQFFTSLFARFRG